MLLVFGAGGCAREAEWLAECVEAAGRGEKATAFVDRDDSPLLGQILHNLPILGMSDALRLYPGAGFVMGIGHPKARARVAAEAGAAGLVPVTLVHPSVMMSRHVRMGAGTMICAGSILTCDITLGEQVQVNLACTICHDVTIGDCVTISPGVHISGNVRIGAFSFIGVGAAIINGTPDQPLVIGEHAVIGAQACVTGNIPAGATVMGVPARPSMPGR